MKRAVAAAMSRLTVWASSISVVNSMNGSRATSPALAARPGYQPRAL
jgi:hypothetical protein